MDNVKDIFEKMKSFFLGEDGEDYSEENNSEKPVQSEDKSLLSIKQNQSKKTSQQSNKNYQKSDQREGHKKSAYSYEAQKDLREQRSTSVRNQASNSSKSMNRESRMNDFKDSKSEEKGRFLNMTRDEKISKIAIREPRVYGDVMDIATLVKDDESVIVNFKLMDDAQARRSIDFFTGVVYTLEGDIQNVGGQIFLLTPASVSVEASAEMSLLARQNYDEFNL
ncbi:cell division protein SepF [Streptococcaceae bacterium ESL0687]|nr:cell division protein SepF [Streptococcaceae bacterium ESL0687]